LALTVLLFTVTRVIFIPQGEFVAFGALTLALLQTGKVPGTVWFLLILAGAAATDIWHGVQRRHGAARSRPCAHQAWPRMISLLAICGRSRPACWRRRR
jgi:branched-chain amino acid transport system permease protein